MKRILIFSLQYYPLVGGAEVAIKEITDRVPETEIEFHMVTLRYDSAAPSKEKIGNVFVHRVGKGMSGMTISKSFSPSFYLQKIFFVPMAAREGMSLQKQFHFDAAWAMMTYMLFPIVLMRLARVRIPYLLTIQEGDPFERVFERLRIRLFSPLLFYGIRHATVVQTISLFLGVWARRCGYEGDLEVVPNGVDLTRFTQKYSSEEIEAKKSELGKKEGDIWLVTTSRLVHKNAVDDVIRAIALLPKNYAFIVYGIGPDEDKLKKLAEKLEITSQVQFKGQISHEELPLAFKACDIFIRPSRSEGMGNSFIEAMAAGLPVIATQEGGIADFLFDEMRNPVQETTGWAVDPNAPEQIAYAVKDIIARPDQVIKVTATAKKITEGDYNWESVAEKMHAIFSKLISTAAYQK